MIEQALFILGATILGLLGSIHLFYTFYTDKFEPRDESLASAMRNSSPKLTRATTMWKAWIGFNASHSLGALIVTAFYVPLVVSNMQLIRDNTWFCILPALIGLCYLILAKKYWFRAPVIGILVATLCFAVAALLTITGM